MCHQFDPDCTSFSPDNYRPAQTNAPTHTDTHPLLREPTPDGGADTDRADNGVTLIIPTYTLTTVGLTRTRTHTATRASVLSVVIGPPLASHSCRLIGTSLPWAVMLILLRETRRQWDTGSVWICVCVCVSVHTVCVCWKKYSFTGWRKCVKIARVQRAADRHPAWQKSWCEWGGCVLWLLRWKCCQPDVLHLCCSRSFLLQFCSNSVSPQPSLLLSLALTLSPLLACILPAAGPLISSFPTRAALTHLLCSHPFFFNCKEKL